MRANRLRRTWNARDAPELRRCADRFPAGQIRRRRGAFLPVVGGSCLNVAIGMARLGAPAGFVGGISTDLLGQMISDYAQSSQVDLRYATRGPTHKARVCADHRRRAAIYLL